MKNLLLTSMAFFVLLDINAQSTDAGVTGNTWTAVKFLGWNASNGINPLFTRTNNINRIRLNGNQTTTLNGVVQPVNGYMGLGPDGFFTANSPWAMLHLEGPNNSGFGGNGWRSWMRTGLLIREESDHLYVGMKNEGSNRSDAVINWSDDATDVDKLRFIFTGNANSGNGEGTNALNPASLNGYEHMRIQQFPAVANETGNPIGHVGIGPLFTDLLAPQNRLHINAESGLATYMQISNVAGGGRPGTGQLETDGLKLGTQAILNGGTQRQYGFLQWQENTPFIVQTDWNGVSGGVAGGERLRVTSVGALVNTETSLYGGLVTPDNVTRIAVSHNGATPLTRPLSLLHLGYNAVGFGTGGWRPWMDIGIFTSNGADHVYLGLKQEGASILDDRMDAVLGWGDNQTGAAGPDNLRFIFTSVSGGSAPATGANGLEGVRMTPTATNGVFTGIGGDPTANQYGTAGNSINPTATLEVNSWGATNVAGGSSGLRFTNLNTTSPTLANPGQGVLSVDADGDVIYVQNTPTASGFGSVCSDNVNNIFTEDRKVNLNNNNFYFEGNNSTNNANNVGLGWACGTSLKAKIDVYSEGTGGLAGSFFTIEDWINGVNSLTPTGAVGVATGNGGGSAGYYGVRGEAYGTNYSGNYAVYGVAPAVANSYAGYFNGDVQAGGLFISSDSTLKREVATLQGALGIVNKLSAKTYYMDSDNNPSFEFSDQQQYGFIAQEVQQVLPSVVKTATLQGEFDQNGNFTEDNTAFLAMNYTAIIPINTQAIKELNEKIEKTTLSDESIKTNVQDLNGSLNKVVAMRGVTYDWNHNAAPQLALDSVNHIGFIAQEIAQIDARLTYVDQDNLLHVQYDKVVPILAEAIEELNQTVEQKDSLIQAQQTTIDDLNNRLTQLENCLSGILPFLCQMSQSAVQANTPQEQEAVRHQLSVQLSNRSAIVLDQNVPNPFAEQTIINFSIPETVQKAQLHFYDGNGKLIQSVDVNERGLGSLTVFGSDLSRGTYTYTLVADGVIVATKKMMKQ